MTTQVVSFHCVLKNKMGSVLGQTFNQNVLLAHDQAAEQLPALVDGLKGIKPGERRSISLAAKSAYGYYNPDLTIQCHPDDFENISPLHLGDKFIFASRNKEQVYRLVEMSKDKLVFDANHPLAGQDLIFEIEVVHSQEVEFDDWADDWQASPTDVSIH
jgi:FKBP-type peptidyl-prolyl cis-trans isomerase SlyD